MKNQLKIIGFLILFVFTGIGCSQYNQDDVILQIDPYTLTVEDYEFIKNSTRYKKNSEKQLEDVLIEEGRMLAFALAHKYDTIEMLNKQEDYGMYHYASRVDGYVWNRKVKPLLNLSEDDLQQAYQKKTKEYSLNFICFPNQAKLQKYDVINHSMKSENDFNSIKEKVSSDIDVKFYSVNLRYPFSPLGSFSNEIYNAKVGDVVGPFETLSGYYIVHIDAIKTVSQNSYEQEKTQINQELLSVLKEKYVLESQQKIFVDANLAINDDAITEMVSKVDTEKKEWPGINRDMILMEYNFNGERRNYTVADFIEFVHCQPIFLGSLSKADDVKNMLKTQVINIYLFAEAQQMGMENDKEYKLYKKMYQRNILLHEYEQKNIYSDISIQENEISDYYQEHQNELEIFETATINTYSFASMNDALEARKKFLSEWANQDDINVKMKMSHLQTKIEKIDMKDTNSQYDNQLINLISQLNIGQVSTPNKVNDKYIIIQLKSKDGTITKPFNYAKEEIKQALFSIKYQEIRNKKNQELKRLYPIKINRMQEYSLDRKSKL